MRGVFEELFADAGSLARRRTSPCGRLDDPGAPRLERGRPARPVRRPRPLGRRHRRRSPARPRRAATSSSARRRARIFETLDRPVHPRRPAQHARAWSPPSACAGWASCGRSSRSRPCGGRWASYFHDPRLRQLFGRYATYCGSSPFLAPATLMLVAHVEQEGVWLVEGGMHRLAEALAGLAGAQRRRRSATAPRPREVAIERGARRRRAPGRRRAARGRRGRRQRRCRGGGRRAARAGRSPARCRAPRPRARSLSAVTWCCWPRPRASRCYRHNVFFSSDYRSRVRRHPARTAGCRGRPPSMSAPRTAATRRPRGRMGPSACSASSTRRRPATPSLCRPAEIEQCADADLRPPGALRPEPDAATPEQSGGDDADGLRAPVPGDGRSALRPGLARLEGLVRPAGGADAGSRASTWRGAARIRGRACRWRRSRAGWRRRACSRTSLRPAGPAGTAMLWWYVDALSDDGRHGLTLIALHRQRVLALLRLGRPARPGDPSTTARSTSPSTALPATAGP